VSDADIEERYHVRLGVPSGASREQLASQLRLELVRLGLPLAEFRETVAAEVLERKLLDNFEVAVPAEAEHVEARLILVPTQAAAIQVRDRLNNGESFGLVAASASIHASRNTAGELSWVPTQSLVKEVGEVAASLDIGSRSDIIEARSGFYFIEITGRENRAVTADGREDIGQQRLEELMAETRERLGTELTITAEQLQKLFLSLSADVG
jgi:parvulin-like peptidyl-prolyl isomerase